MSNHCFGALFYGKDDAGMMKIEMVRGDLLTRSFVIRGPDKLPYTETLDNIFLTIKKEATDREFLIQKRLSDGGITSLGEGRYQFTIEPEDTDGLSFGAYAFDIEVVKAGEVKKTFIGSISLGKEVTHVYNEG